jgi:TRAP-type C4-dicarboxylate transport system permease small subunit
MSSSNNPIDELIERPNDKFGRFLYDLAYFLAILGGIILVIVILINFISILSRIIFLNPLVGDFELVEIGSAIAISSFLPLCHLKKGNVIVDFITAKLNFKKIAFLDCISSVIYGLIALFFTWRMFFGARDMYNYQEETMLLQFPIWIPFLPVTFSFGLLSICCLYTFYRELVLSRS